MKIAGRLPGGGSVGAGTGTRLGTMAPAFFIVILPRIRVCN